MEWFDLLPTATDARAKTVDIRRWADHTTPEGRRAALQGIELDLLIVIMQAPWLVRIPLVAAAVLVRLTRG